jgi:hypothetical protein
MVPPGRVATVCPATWMRTWSCAPTVQPPCGLAPSKISEHEDGCLGGVAGPQVKARRSTACPYRPGRGLAFPEAEGGPITVRDDRCAPFAQLQRPDSECDTALPDPVGRLIAVVGEDSVRVIPAERSVAVRALSENRYGPSLTSGAPRLHGRANVQEPQLIDSGSKD